MVLGRVSPPVATGGSPVAKLATGEPPVATGEEERVVSGCCPPAGFSGKVGTVFRSRKAWRGRESFWVCPGGKESSAPGRKSVQSKTVQAAPPDPWKETVTTGGAGTGVSTRPPGPGTVDRVGIKTREDSALGRRTAIASPASPSLSWRAGPPLGGRG